MKFAPDSVVQMIDVLNQLGVVYMVTGSLARNVYCVPRSTVDADFVVVLSSEQFSVICNRLKDDFEQEPQMSFETVTGKVQHKFRHKSSQFLTEIFEADLQDPHEQARLGRRRRIDVDGLETFIPTAEDIIVQKLRWFARIHRKKDGDDLTDLLAENWSLLDWHYIEHWCAQHNTLDLLNRFRGDVERLLHEEG